MLCYEYEKLYISFSAQKLNGEFVQYQQQTFIYEQTIFMCRLMILKKLVILIYYLKIFSKNLLQYLISVLKYVEFECYAIIYFYFQLICLKYYNI